VTRWTRFGRRDRSVLSPSAVKRFYDRFGARQDSQAFYEDRALDDLSENAGFAEARTITEFGCGTGRFARQILTRFPDVSYTGFDVSTTMLGLTRRALAPFGPRAAVLQLAPGIVRLPVSDKATDRLVSTYVLDLLSTTDIEVFFQEAWRVLEPGGRLCLVGLTTGSTAVPRLVARLWSLVHRLRPQLVGGCRPVRLSEYCHPARWDVLHHRTVTSWAISSEVLIARPRARWQA
jgi:ubiquinone/menaquinone biosynthesis C-methylase UbiE